MTSLDDSDDTAEPARAGTVALMGRSNVGKSTLLNAALQMPLAIVSPKPQTTRDHLLGVVRHRGAEIGLLDTPGLHRAATPLGRAMNRSARGAARAADVVVFVVALPDRIPKQLVPHPGDLRLLSQMPVDAPLVLVINKIDRLRDKSLLLPLIEVFAEKAKLASVVPISALRDDGIRRVLDEVALLLPAGAHRHGQDVLTDRPMRYFAAEYVREAILAATAGEVPHAVAVTIDEYREADTRGIIRISATIHVEREGQKRILVGRGGSMLKRIGIAARTRFEALADRKTHLELFVRVTGDWRNAPRQLAELGLDVVPRRETPR